MSAPDRRPAGIPGPEFSTLWDVQARAQWVLLQDPLVVARRQDISRPRRIAHPRNPLVDALVHRAFRLLSQALSETAVRTRSREELARLVSAVIDDLAASRAAGLSPQEHAEAVMDILDRGLAGDADGVPATPVPRLE